MSTINGRWKYESICRLQPFINYCNRLHYVWTTVWFVFKEVTYNSDSWVSSPLTFWTPFQMHFCTFYVSSNFIILKDSFTKIYFYSVRVGKRRMAAPGDAFSAALRRSQDLDIGEQKTPTRWQVSCTLAGPQILLFSASNIQQVGPFGKLLCCALPRHSLWRLFFQWKFQWSSFFRCKAITLSGKGRSHLELNSPVKLQLVMFWCVKEGRMPKWANATGRSCTKDVNIALPPTQNRLYYLQEGGSSYK